MTDEGAALLPVLTDAFERIGLTLEKVKTPHKKEVLSVGVVGTFAVGWLLPRLRDFQVKHPFIDLRLFSNNNRVDLAGDGLDFAIRFGDGHWHGTEASKLFLRHSHLFAPLSWQVESTPPVIWHGSRYCGLIEQTSGLHGFRRLG